MVVITSGANMNFDRLRLVSELADIGALKEAMLATTIPESPGSFRGFIDTALADTNQSVTEFKYRYGTAYVMIAVIRQGWFVHLCNHILCLDQC